MKATKREERLLSGLCIYVCMHVGLEFAKTKKGSKKVGRWYELVVVGFHRLFERSFSISQGHRSRFGVIRLNRQACIEMANLDVHMINGTHTRRDGNQLRGQYQPMELCSECERWLSHDRSHTSLAFSQH